MLLLEPIVLILLGSFSAFLLPEDSAVLKVLAFLGDKNVALTTTAAIVANAAAASTVSPILCAIAVCAGGIGLSLPNDSGFWAVSRFFHLNEVDTIRSWTIGGFVSGVSILIFTCLLSLCQGFLPGLV